MIKFLSTPWIGCTHDFTMLKLEFPPEQGWFKEKILHLDLGYQGFQEIYACKQAVIPHKKGKGQTLTEVQQAENKQTSQIRISVEHSLAGLKRYRVLSDRLRNKKFELYDAFMEVCAGFRRIA